MLANLRERSFLARCFFTHDLACVKERSKHVLFFEHAPTGRAVSLKRTLVSLHASVFFKQFTVLIAFATCRFEVEDQIFHVQAKL